jgi:hypothetical protein
VIVVLRPQQVAAATVILVGLEKLRRFVLAPGGFDPGLAGRIGFPDSSFEMQGGMPDGHTLEVEARDSHRFKSRPQLRDGGRFGRALAGGGFRVRSDAAEAAKKERKKNESMEFPDRDMPRVREVVARWKEKAEVEPPRRQDAKTPRRQVRQGSRSGRGVPRGLGFYEMMPTRRFRAGRGAAAFPGELRVVPPGLGGFGGRFRWLTPPANLCRPAGTRWVWRPFLVGYVTG